MLQRASRVGLPRPSRESENNIGEKWESFAGGAIVRGGRLLGDVSKLEVADHSLVSSLSPPATPSVSLSRDIAPITPDSLISSADDLYTKQWYASLEFKIYESHI